MSDETATVPVPAHQKIPENGGNRLRTDGRIGSGVPPAEPEVLDGDPPTNPPSDPPPDSPDGHIGSGDPHPLADGHIGSGDPEPLLAGHKPMEGHIGSGTPAPHKGHSHNGGKHRRPATGHIGSGDPVPEPDPGPEIPGDGEPTPSPDGHIGSGTGPVAADTK